MTPPDWKERTRCLIGEENIKKLNNTSIAIIGLGGVGGTAAESLCRAGIGEIIIVDKDKFSSTNINRQLFATTKTMGKNKCDAAKDRLLEINPNCKIKSLNMCYNEKTSQTLFKQKPDIIIDAIDMVTSKLHLAKYCNEHKIPLLMCLGTGNRLNPEEFHIGDISQTAGCGCPLARVIRKELKKIGVKKQTVLYSTETPLKITVESANGQHIPSSSPFCPPVAGYMLAAYATRMVMENLI